MAAGGAEGIARTNPLIRLEPATFVFLRPWGKCGRFTFFTVNRRRRQSDLSQVMYNLRVDEATQEATLVDEDTTELVRSEGGLHSMNEPMRIFSRCEPGRSAYVCNKYLWDFMETRDEEQFLWHLLRTPPGKVTGSERPIGISKRKHFRGGHNWLASVLHSVKAASTTLWIRDECLTTWQKVFLVMGMVKFFYCYYKLHTAPMPSAILHLMPPGMPASNSMECLQNFTDVTFRVACYDNEKKQIMEILDSSTREIVLIQHFKSREQHLNNRFYFLDQYGQTVFSSAGHINLDVYGNDENRIGRFHPTLIILGSGDQTCMYQIQADDDMPESLTSTAGRTLHYQRNQRNFFVRFFLGEDNLYHCNGLGCLPNEMKALALCYGISQAIFRHKMWKDDSFPVVNQYQFRSKQMCPST